MQFLRHAREIRREANGDLDGFVPARACQVHIYQLNFIIFSSYIFNIILVVIDRLQY